MNDKNIPLTKFIATFSYYSRRKAEELIRAGKVKVNDRLAVLGEKVGEVDKVFVNGKELVTEKKNIYIALNKPNGYVCTAKKFYGEKNIFELLGKELENDKLICAGRLDKDSRGLVLLSNDGDWVNDISHPSHGSEKEYLVRVQIKNVLINFNNVAKEFMRGMQNEGEFLKAKKAEYLGGGVFKIILEYGKKRHIRRMMGAVGLMVDDLQRVRVGSIKLNDLKEGTYKVI